MMAMGVLGTLYRNMSREILCLIAAGTMTLKYMNTTLGAMRRARLFLRKCPMRVTYGSSENVVVLSQLEESVHHDQLKDQAKHQKTQREGEHLAVVGGRR